MEALSYPIVDNSSGDLYVSSEEEYIAIFRAWLMTDVYVGEREFYPQYGSDIQLFSPTAQNTAIEAATLEQNLNIWCVTPEFNFTYKVIDDTIIDYDFSIRIIFPE